VVSIDVVLDYRNLLGETITLPTIDEGPEVFSGKFLENRGKIKFFCTFEVF
jgi:hypothetical protein